MTIKSLKIARRRNLPLFLWTLSIFLMFDKRLEDGRTLADYNIQNLAPSFPSLGRYENFCKDPNSKNHYFGGGTTKAIAVCMSEWI